MDIDDVKYHSEHSTSESEDSDGNDKEWKPRKLATEGIATSNLRLEILIVHDVAGKAGMA